MAIKFQLTIQFNIGYTSLSSFNRLTISCETKFRQKSIGTNLREHRKRSEWQCNDGLKKTKTICVGCRLSWTEAVFMTQRVRQQSNRGIHRQSSLMPVMYDTVYHHRHRLQFLRSPNLNIIGKYKVFHFQTVKFDIKHGKNQLVMEPFMNDVTTIWKRLDLLPLNLLPLSGTNKKLYFWFKKCVFK